MNNKIHPGSLKALWEPANKLRAKLHAKINELKDIPANTDEFQTAYAQVQLLESQWTAARKEASQEELKIFQAAVNVGFFEVLK